MFGKHVLAAKILQEAKDQGITLAVAKPIDEDISVHDKLLLASIGKKTPMEELRDMSIPKLDKFTPEQLKAYQKRQDKLHDAAEKMARDAEMIERAIAHFRKFELTEKGIATALKYISSMMPKHYELSTDARVLNFTLLDRYGMAKRMEYVIEDLKSGFSSSRPFTIIDNMICIPSNHPRWIKRAFEFQLKQHLDYELRFKKRDQDRYNILFAKKD